MTLTEEKHIGKIVAEDYRTAAVFKSFGIDFCCKGNRSIAEVCDKSQIDQDKLMNEIEKVINQETKTTTDHQSWPLDLLADYIEKKHHRYVEASLPVLNQYLEKICKVHGSHHPELYEITDIFSESVAEFTKHMKKEELILFPFIRKMVTKKQADGSSFGSVENPVNMMKEDHSAEGERFERIAKLSNNYTPPSDACNTYRVSFSLLKEFEEDLHTHIHLENNILFPKAIEMEKSILA